MSKAKEKAAQLPIYVTFEVNCGYNQSLTVKLLYANGITDNDELCFEDRDGALIVHVTRLETPQDTRERIVRMKILDLLQCFASDTIEGDCIHEESFVHISEYMATQIIEVLDSK